MNIKQVSILRNYIWLLSFLITFGTVTAQVKDSIKTYNDTQIPSEEKSDSLYRELMGFEIKKTGKDSLYNKETYSAPARTIQLDQVLILGGLKFSTQKERIRYLILRRKTRKVWPYATLASTRLVELNKRLGKIRDKSDRRNYIKMVQEYFENKYKEELKNLTMTEGQILVKLLYRQTGITAYDLVKDFKSGWTAFWYNAAAGLFNISLKKKYTPINVKEDYYIEAILRRSFQKNILEPQKPEIEIHFLEAMEKWSYKKY